MTQIDQSRVCERERERIEKKNNEVVCYGWYMLKHVTIDQRDIKIYNIASRMSSCDDITYNPMRPSGINKLELPIKDNAKLFRRRKKNDKQHCVSHKSIQNWGSYLQTPHTRKLSWSKMWIDIQIIWIYSFARSFHFLYLLGAIAKCIEFSVIFHWNCVLSPLVEITSHDEYQSWISKQFCAERSRLTQTSK